MVQRGRKSAASNVVSIAAVGLRPNLTPSRPLTKPERQIWDLVIKEHRHLRSIDAPLLTGYCIACVKMYKAENPMVFEKVSRVAMALGTKLRLTPQAGMQAVSVGRRYQSDNGGRKPWDRELWEPEDE